MEFTAIFYHHPPLITLPDQVFETLLPTEY